jgi:hypothetical protein
MAQGPTHPFQPAPDVIVTEKTLHGDLASERRERVVGRDAFQQMEAAADRVLRLFVEEEFDDMNAFRLPASEEAIEKAFPIGGHRLGEESVIHNVSAGAMPAGLLSGLMRNRRSRVALRSLAVK